MIELQLADIKWMDHDLAARLGADGVTVENMASASPDEFLKAHPYVGPINAWLLTSEAAHLVNTVRAGVYEPERVKEEKLEQELAELEAEQYEKRPQMQWPPPPPPPPQYSARVRRIRKSLGLDGESGDGDG